MNPNHTSISALTCFGVLLSASAIASEANERPNILWLTFEDTSEYEFGCYGNKSVKTPVIDSMARNGLQFMNAYSNGPQSSPARSSIITGCYSTTYSMDWHRKRATTPQNIFFPQFLRDQGYFCTNNKKTDYNSTNNESACWDECSTTATYNSDAKSADQPFFAVFNSNITHMSRLTSTHLDGRRDFAAQGLDPNKLELPPHVPDLYPVRSDYAFHLEGVNDIDRWVNMFIDDLKQKNLSDNTIIFIFSDHGGCLPRGKAFSYESSFRVPMVIYLPKKWQHLSKMPIGQPTTRPVAFADLASTVLSIAGIKPAEHLQGMAFLGKYEANPRQHQIGYVCNRAKHYVPARVIKDDNLKYVRYYIPYKPDAAFNSFQWQMPANLYWDKAYFEGQKLSKAGKMPYEIGPAERLYDLSKDPYELNDLSNDPKYADNMSRLRKLLGDHIRQSKDLGFFPLSCRLTKTPLYNSVREQGYDLELLYQLAELTANVSMSDLPLLKKALTSNRTEIKFWATVNMAIIARSGKLTTVPEELIALLKDEDQQIAYEAAYALCYTNRSKDGFDHLLSHMADASALEILSLDKEMSKRIPASIIKALEESSSKFENTTSEAVSEGSNAITIRKVLVNLGKLPAEQLYGKNAYDQGLKVNKERRKLIPTPFTAKK